MIERLRRIRQQLEEDLGDDELRHLSAVSRSRCDETARMIEAHARGRVLDVGCGRMPFRGLVLRRAGAYEGLDREARAPGVTWLADAATLEGVPRAAYDAVLCLEVLEHVPDPARVLAAIRDVLRPGGKLLVTAPHLSRLHELPHDYWRFTGPGLRAAAERAGLEVVELRPYAGLASFLAHQLSTVLLGIAWPVPGLRRVALLANRGLLVRIPLWLDRAVDRSHLFPAGHALVATRAEGPSP